METTITIMVIAGFIYALGYGKGRDKGQAENVARAVASLIKRG